MQIKVTILLILCFNVVFGNHSDNRNPDNSALNTAANVSYLTPLEKEIVLEINKLRSNPAEYAIKYIAPLAKNYQRKMLYYPGDKPLQTNEGVSALNECVRELKKQSSLPILYPNAGLTNAAKDHVKDQSKSGRTGHRGGDNSNLKVRLERYGKWEKRIAENIAYGGFTAQQIVIYLLIDDGIRDRGHRLTFLHPDLKMVGVATGFHPVYKSMCVIDFAGSFTENNRR